ncbi:NAD(P)-dependent oxidoreductase [Gammaproteobacteria bacterium]|nr:NAD(P)-dependent oxidoreductase [Gammaproteobacteria bacterium]|tara:strand:- start:70 stop:903 length:834 start_codon:yes stop_codon:yes gene_type:complete
MAKHIVVTGGTGFLGRHVVETFLNEGFEVTALVRNKSKAKDVKQLKKANIESCEIYQKNLTYSFPPQSTLIHCAWADVQDSLSSKHLSQHLNDNYQFLSNVINQKKIKKIIVSGTCYEYGLQYGPMLSSTPTRPNTPYAKAKVELHKKLLKLQSRSEFILIWARLFYMYGEGQDEKSIIPLFEKALKNSEKVFNMSYGEQLLDYLPVHQAAKQISSLIEKNSGTYNICSGSPISLRRLLEDKMKKMNKKIELHTGYFPYRAEDSIAIWGGDPLKLKS